MRKAAWLLTFAASSLLLSACGGIPEEFNFEQIIGWRDRFIYDFSSSSKIAALVFQLVAIFAIGGLFIGLGGLIQNLHKGRSIAGGGYLTGTLLVFATAGLYIYLWVDRQITTAFFLTNDITLNQVVSAMHWPNTPWEVLDLDKIVTAGWAIGLTVVLPLIYAFWQLPMLIGGMFVIGWSAAEGSKRIVGYLVSSLLTRWLFLISFAFIVAQIGGLYPNWDFPGVDFVMNALYVGTVTISMFFCFGVIPAATTLSWGPKEQHEGAGEVLEPRRDRERAGLESLLAIPIPAPAAAPSTTSHDSGNEPEGQNGLREGPLPDVAKEPEKGPLAQRGINPAETPTGFGENASQRSALPDIDKQPAPKESVADDKHLPGVDPTVRGGKSPSGDEAEDQGKSEGRLPVVGELSPENEGGQKTVVQDNPKGKKPSMSDIVERPEGQGLPPIESPPPTDIESPPRSETPKPEKARKPALELGEHEDELPSLNE